MRVRADTDYRVRPTERGPTRRDFLRTSACSLGTFSVGCLSRSGDGATGDERGSSGRDPPDLSELSLDLDESFEGSALDASRWNKTYPWGNGLTDTYDGYGAPENVVVRDGEMALRAERKRQRGKTYTTGVVSSVDSFSFGYFEAEIKVPPASPGFWPAFWLTSDDAVWPEIDICEFFGADPDVWTAFHFLDRNGRKQRVITSHEGGDFSREFHRYSVRWRPDRIDWYVDGTRRFHHRHRFAEDVTMNLIINFGIGPPFLDAPRRRDLPAEMRLRNVRIWQR